MNFHFSNQLSMLKLLFRPTILLTDIIHCWSRICSKFCFQFYDSDHVVQLERGMIFTAINTRFPKTKLRVGCSIFYVS